MLFIKKETYKCTL